MFAETLFWGPFTLECLYRLYYSPTSTGLWLHIGRPRRMIRSHHVISQNLSSNYVRCRLYLKDGQEVHRTWLELQLNVLSVDRPLVSAGHENHAGNSAGAGRALAPGFWLLYWCKGFSYVPALMEVAAHGCMANMPCYTFKSCVSIASAILLAAAFGCLPYEGKQMLLCSVRDRCSIVVMTLHTVTVVCVFLQRA